MNEKRSLIIVFVMIVISSVLLTAAPDRVAGGGFFLVDGIGLQGGDLEIGRAAPQGARVKRDEPGWYSLDRLPIYFKKTEDGRVSIIRCDNYCLTTRSISIGSGVGEVLWSYGTPMEERRMDGNRFLVYSGVGFMLDARGAAVERIYIFPKTLRQ